MKPLSSLGLKYDGKKLWALDQTLLPFEEKWVICETPEEMISMIKELKVRGAPLIGVAAALSLALFAEKGATGAEISKAALALKNARPTAVNLAAAIDRMTVSPRLTETAEEIFEEDVRLCLQIAEHGFGLIKDGDSILTHCNAGGLATAGIGTAVGVIRHAHDKGKRIHVFVDETRPLLQGARLTAWELARAGIPHTLICDNMAASLMAQKKIQLAIVGADRIAKNGDFANKIGTYGVAVLCHHHRIPFYTAAPMTTVDSRCHSGREIPIEQRREHEVKGFHGREQIQWANPSSPVDNPAFDVTPHELLSGIVLDTGVKRAPFYF